MKLLISYCFSAITGLTVTKLAYTGFLFMSKSIEICFLLIIISKSKAFIWMMALNLTQSAETNSIFCLRVRTLSMTHKRSSYESLLLFSKPVTTLFRAKTPPGSKDTLPRVVKLSKSSCWCLISQIAPLWLLVKNILEPYNNWPNPYKSREVSTDSGTSLINPSVVTE